MNLKSFQNKSVMVLGSSGFLGSNLRILFSDRPCFFFVHAGPPIFPAANDFVIGEYARGTLIDLIKRLNIDVIINCVGFTNVDACERSLSLNITMNLELPVLLDELCRSLNVKLVHISTDHFYSERKIPRAEGESMLAVNEYGRIKLLADEAVLRNERSLVIRTNFFGFNPSQRQKLLDWVKINLENDVKISGFDDVFFTPISVSILAFTLISLIERDTFGLVNIVGSESISKYQFLRLIAKALGSKESLVLSDSISNSNLLVKRPNYLSLSNSKLKSILPEFQNLSISEMISLELVRYEPSGNPFNSRV